jgi:2-amino-4-hydroxy-6-hydroxymethyldihydropteridine diphosphokinase
MVELISVYLGLGGNVGAADETIASTLQSIQQLDGVYGLRVSPFYQTKPISDIPQDPYVNAVCHFNTNLPIKTLFSRLESIEKAHGKIPKPKNAARPIDIDILFYGSDIYNDGKLQVPHPFWHERLFVMVPLKDLTPSVTVANCEYDLQNLIDSFSREEKSQVKILHPAQINNCEATCTA